MDDLEREAAFLRTRGVELSSDYDGAFDVGPRLDYARERYFHDPDGNRVSLWAVERNWRGGEPFRDRLAGRGPIARALREAVVRLLPPTLWSDLGLAESQVREEADVAELVEFLAAGYELTSALSSGRDEESLMDRVRRILGRGDARG